MSGKSFKGGISCHQEYSYKGNPSGGAGSTSGLWVGRYGTSGLDGYGLGSGDSQLNTIHFGSSGGRTFKFNGTDGGGGTIH